MIKIILYGNPCDANLKKLIIQNICQFVTVTTIENNNRLISYGKGKEIFLLDGSHLTEITTDKTILIVEDNAKISKIRKVSKNTIAVVNSNNEKQISILSKMGIAGITCGMSLKDTFTFSSINSDNAVISLQRLIKTLTKTDCEPFEIPICISNPADYYHLLCYVSILTLIFSNDVINKKIIINYQ